ncbi:MAG: Pr6Pr family membrane protein [Chitinophagaceae bacterium]|nr:Pr6Pr family membrane protein [Chitinophagaceae bacterium]MBK7734987.1 Pr6Pr family membrane protein [Chitinophagaceae bacterium]MBK8775730.1 Pr6Pr family membrane protein [Chitinophagaceae bacterium]
MKKGLMLCIALFSLLAVVTQYYLMLANSTHSVFETSIRFFSYFTILSNTIVAVYFTYLTYNFLIHKENIQFSFGTLSAITVYITIVGLVYQFLLRQTWNPAGMQKVADETLHSLNPLLVIIFWFLHIKTNKLPYSQIKYWLVFPLLYLAFVLIRGHYSNFYPYPFLDVPGLGLKKVTINCLGMALFFYLIAAMYIWFANKIVNRK